MGVSMDREIGYEELLERNAAAHTNADISNSSLLHAELGTRCLFKHAKQGSTAMILSGHFYKPFWEKLLADIDSFVVTNNGTIELILVNKEDDGFGLAHELSEKFLGKVSVWLIEEERLRKNVGIKKEKLPNFMVIPEAGSRFEISDEKRRDDLVSAIINFGDDERNSRLAKSFATLKELSSKKAA
jgi:hypothetical protein